MRSTGLLALELWGLGDVLLALPFLRAAAKAHDVTLLAKPAFAPMLERFAADVEILPFVAPWTAFSGKYRLHEWPWGSIARCLTALRRRGFSVAVSARCDPRDHLLMWLSGSPRRVGFPRLGSGTLLTDPLVPPSRGHRYLFWQAAARAPRLALGSERGRAETSTPEGLEALIGQLSGSRAFIGNDSGPGHLAASLGVPTFTIFGPQLAERFTPPHPRAAWIEGKPCPPRPCSDS